MPQSIESLSMGMDMPMTWVERLIFTAAPSNGKRKRHWLYSKEGAPHLMHPRFQFPESRAKYYSISS